MLENHEKKLQSHFSILMLRTSYVIENLYLALDGNTKDLWIRETIP